MARTRSIKPGFFDNDILGDLPPLTRLLFIGLWCIADREGRLEDRPRKIKKSILGYDDVDANGTDEMLQTLQESGFILRYQGSDGEKYIQVVNFLKHQNPHIKEKSSDIPPPTDMYDTSTVQEQCKDGECTEQSGPITGTLLPITGTCTPPTPPPGDGETEPSKSSESLAVETAAGAGDEKSAGHFTTLMDRFAVFWEAYPKKRKKAKAEAAWKVLKPDDNLLGRMLSALNTACKSAEWTKSGGQYIPHPGNWLEDKGWEDDYTPRCRSADNYQEYKRPAKQRDIYEV